MKTQVKKHLCLAASATILVFASVACDDTGLVPAGFPNVVDTVTLYALQGTPISTPSAFDISSGAAVRTDQGFPFDFAFFRMAETPRYLAYPKEDMVSSRH